MVEQDAKILVSQQQGKRESKSADDVKETRLVCETSLVRHQGPPGPGASSPKWPKWKRFQEALKRTGRRGGMAPSRSGWFHLQRERFFPPSSATRWNSSDQTSMKGSENERLRRPRFFSSSMSGFQEGRVQTSPWKGLGPMAVKWRRPQRR